MLKKTTADGEHVFARRSALQVASWEAEARIAGTIADATARFELPTGATLIEISATEDCYINFGDDTVVASSTVANGGSRLFMAGVQIVVVPEDSGVPFTHLAFIRVSTNGIIQAEQLAA